MMAVMAGCILLLAALLGMCQTHFPPDGSTRGTAGVSYTNTDEHNHNAKSSTGQSDGIHWKAAKRDVKNCPKTCMCSEDHKYSILSVKQCEKDPISELPKLLNAYMDVKQLYIRSAHLTRLPAEVAQMSKLSFLALDDNEFEQVPDEVLENEHLTLLSLQGNKIQNVPSKISKLSKLSSLMLSRNPLELFPVEVFQLFSLRLLELQYNTITEVPQEIVSLSNLRHIDFRHNKIQVVPQGIWNLTQLDTLRLANNHIKTLPNNIHRLARLRLLYLESNEIGTLPHGLSKLYKLKYLYLGYNCLTEVLLKFPSNLLVLSLHHNEITNVACGNFDLTTLDLSYNSLQYLNCSASNDIMQKLTLSHNYLKEMPCSLELQGLSILDISHNEIQTIPENCLLLTSRPPYRRLELDLSYNRISVLHSWHLCSNVNLGQISFQNNNISIIDPDVFSDSNCLPPSAILNLADNKLSTLDCWPLVLSMSKTVTVDLSGNLLTRFTNSAARQLSLNHFGSTFLLRKNKIRHFMDVLTGWKVIFNSTDQLHSFLGSALFDLSDNPLVCDCVDYEVFQYIQLSGNVRYKATNLVCDKPHALRGQNPGHISLEKFVCDINKTCPPGCVCTNIPHLTTLSVVCTTYNHTDIPDTIPHLPKQNFVYHLNLCNLNLSTISSRPYLWKATELRLSNNSITAIHLQHTGIFRKVKVLYLENNHLQTLPESVTSITNQTAEDVRLGNNPWVCDCNTMVMKDWITSNGDMVKDKDSIICHSPASIAGTKVMNMERSLVCPNKNMVIIYVVVGIAIILVIAVTNIAVVDRVKHAKWRLVGTDECVGEGKEFDVFVSYANEDHEYVEGFLIPELEKHDYRVCFHRVHFHGGKPILLNISEAIEKSKRTLVFFSNNFKDSNFGLFEFRLAHHLDVDNNTRRLITIKDTDLNMDALEVSDVHYFQTYTYIARENVNFWRCLERTLPKQKLGAEVWAHE